MSQSKSVLHSKQLHFCSNTWPIVSHWNTCISPFAVLCSSIRMLCGIFSTRLSPVLSHEWTTVDWTWPLVLLQRHSIWLAVFHKSLTSRPERFGKHTPMVTNGPNCSPECPALSILNLTFNLIRLVPIKSCKPSSRSFGLIGDRSFNTENQCIVAYHAGLSIALRCSDSCLHCVVYARLEINFFCAHSQCSIYFLALL